MGTGSGRARPRGRRLRGFAASYERFLCSLLEPGLPGTGADFADGLYALAARARKGELSASLRTEEALRTLTGVWNRPHIPVAAARPTLHDALTATDLLEHALRPLAAVPRPGGVAHAVSGGWRRYPG